MSTSSIHSSSKLALLGGTPICSKPLEIPTWPPVSERTAARIQNRLSDIPGVHIQSRGKEASPQGYYGLVLLFDEGPLAEVLGDRIREAISAEGLPVANTYGPVYRHMLYNMDPLQYRIADGTCPVAENIAVGRVAVLPHQLLTSSDDNLDAIGNIVAKIAENANALCENSVDKE